MISILIPTYNYNCVSLVSDIHQQAERLKFSYEILVADDYSDEIYKEKNRIINKLPHCKYIELEENIGRARIRNYLGRIAQFDYLLFMDCDAEVVHRDFIKRYLEARHLGKVVYGGLLHPEVLPSKEVSLAYIYEKNAEPKNTAEKRSLNPYKVFRTFNFMIDRITFLNHQFDEAITKYGHEDTLFGKSLERDKIEIIHIDNPLLNCGLDTNIKVLKKTEESLNTLFEIREKVGESSNVLKAYRKLENWHLTGITSYLFKMTSNIIRKNLLSSHPILHLFAFYKLGYLCMIFQNAKRK